MNESSISSAWKSLDRYTIREIVLLMQGVDPSDVNIFEENIDRSPPPNSQIYLNMFIRAVDDDEISHYHVKHEYIPTGYGADAVDYLNTLIKREAIESYFKQKNIQDHFFNTGDVVMKAYQDKSSPFYAPKLAAAIAVWEALTNNVDLLKKTSPKKAAQKWLSEHAEELDILYKGEINKTASEEIAKIVNFEEQGGVPKTIFEMPKKTCSDYEPNIIPEYEPTYKELLPHAKDKVIPF